MDDALQPDEAALLKQLNEVDRLAIDANNVAVAFRLHLRKLAFLNKEYVDITFHGRRAVSRMEG